MAVLSSLCCIFRPLGVADYVVSTEFSCQQDLQAVGVDSKTEFTYSDDTYEVTLTCSNTDNATYSLDGGKAVSYKDGDKVTIKHGDSDVSKLELRAENAEGVKTYERLEFTYM